MRSNTLICKLVLYLKYKQLSSLGFQLLKYSSSDSAGSKFQNEIWVWI